MKSKKIKTADFLKSLLGAKMRVALAGENDFEILKSAVKETEKDGRIIFLDLKKREGR